MLEGVPRQFIRDIYGEKFTKIMRGNFNMKPPILDEQDIDKYLDSSEDITPFLFERNKPNFEFYEISKDVNKPQNNNSNLIEKVNLI